LKIKTVRRAQIPSKNQWLNCSAEKQKKTILRRKILRVSVCLTMSLIGTRIVESKKQVAF